MSSEEKKLQSDSPRAEEPEAAFKSIRFFNSFEEENEFTVKQRALLTHNDCLRQVEELRSRVFYQYLLPNGRWPSITKKFEIVEPYANNTGK